MYDAHVPQSELSVLASALHEMRSVFDLMDTDSEADWRNIDARLAAFSDALAGVRATLTQSADAGYVAAQRQIHAVADQIRHWTGQTGTGGDFFAHLVADADVSEALAADLERHAHEASDATAAFGRFLDEELGPRGREVDACGRERYALGSRYFLGTTIDLEETYAWGWEELARIEDDMAKVAGRIVPGGTVDDAVAALDADPSRHIRGKQEFAAWMQRARRPDRRRDGGGPLRHPGAGATDRVPHRADQRRAASTTRVRARTSAAPGGCGGQCPTAPSVLDLGRGLDRLPRGRARPPPPGRAGAPTEASC